MNELIEGLGLDWKILIAQIVNFTILLLVLWKFAYKPLKKMLHDRTHKIEESLKNAEQIEQNLKGSESKRDEVLSQARRDAQELLDKAQAEGKALKEEMTTRAKTEVEKIVGEAHADIARAKETMIREAKAEIGDMVIAASEKVLSEKLDAKHDHELIEKALKGMK